MFEKFRLSHGVYRRAAYLYLNLYINILILVSVRCALRERMAT